MGEEQTKLDAEGNLIGPGRYVMVDTGRDYDSMLARVFRAGGELWYHDGSYCWRVSKLHDVEAAKFLRVTEWGD